MRNISSSSRKVLASENEYEVAGILLNLPQLFFRPTSRNASLLSWATKRKRSATHDDKEVAVVNNKIPTITPLSVPVSPSQFHLPSLKKRRRKYVSKIKTKEKLLKKVDKLTQCRDSLIREVGVVRIYYNNLLTMNSILNALRRQQLKKGDTEEGKTKIVTKGSKNGETDAATVYPSQQDMSFMDPTTQSFQALPPKASDPLGGNPALNMSRNGLAIGRKMDPSSWPYAYPLEGRIGVDQVNKFQATEARRRKMIKIK